MVPTRTGKPGKMGDHFPVREKSGNFAKTGKVGEFYPKYWEKKKKYVGKFLKIMQVSDICQPVHSENPANMVPYFK